MRNDYTVYNANDYLIMEIKEAFDSNETYVIEMNNRENQMISILFFMVVALDNYDD